MKMEFQNIEVPKELDQVVADSMDRIYTGQRCKKIRNQVVGWGSAAAVFTGAAMVCVSNPALAANIPVIGHIFERLQNSYGYQGDFDDVKTSLNSKYVQTADGLTVTLSEVYCNDQALYLTMQLTSEVPFPETYEYVFNGLGNFSFNPTQQVAYSELDGEYLDDHTYVGIMRMDLNELTTDTSEYDAEREKALAAGEEWNDAIGIDIDNENWDKYVKKAEIPDQFSMQLDFFSIEAALVNPDPRPDWPLTEESVKEMSDDEWHEIVKIWYQEHPDWAKHPNEHEEVFFDGHWKFDLDVTKNTSDTQVIELNDLNEQGIGIEKIVKDRFEITMYDTYADPAQMVDYFPVMLDADARLMPYGGDGSVNTVAIQDRDISHVDIFLVDYDLWMDDLKGNYWSGTDPTPEELQTYRNMLLETCAYHTEVELK